ncbi:MAG: NUDIX domain-containing protein [Chloroflexi bacterium]|nr:NUDIX domain-containing protein [Chloroflexota bacterium]
MNNLVFAAALGQRDKCVALASSSDGWQLPAAPVPTGASPESVALQALIAITGVPAAIDRLAGVYSGPDGLLIAFMASLDDGEPRAGIEFFEWDALPAPIAPDLHVAALADWAASHTHGFMTTRYCPRCGGARLSVQQRFGRDRMTCRTCGFIFFRDPKVGAGVFIEDTGRVLLIRRGVNPGMDLWCLPSGFIEHDEAPEAAAVREAFEETGLHVELDELMGLHSYLDPARGNGILILYRAHATGGTLSAGDDAKEAHYFAPSELPAADAIAFRTHRIVLNEWKERRSSM